MFRKFTLAAAFVALSAGSSLAADLVESDPIPDADPVFTWAGAFIGAHVGYAWGDASTTGLAGGNGGPFDQGANGIGHVTFVEPDAIFGGVQVGYNWQFDQFVAGVELDAGYLGADDSQFGFQNANAIARGTNDTGMIVDYGWYGVLAGRLGYATDRVLFYGKGGLAIADVDVQSGDLDGAQLSAADFDISDTTSTSGTETGYAIGGGIEYALNGGWTSRPNICTWISVRSIRPTLMATGIIPTWTYTRSRLA